MEEWGVSRKKAGNPRKWGNRRHEREASGINSGEKTNSTGRTNKRRVGQDNPRDLSDLSFSFGHKECEKSSRCTGVDVK